MTHISSVENGLSDKELLQKVEAAHEKLETCLNILNTEVLLGQPEINKLTLTGVLANKSTMIVGKPGLAKSRLMSNLAKIFNLDFARVQCTSDLMPADIIGTEILQTKEDGSKAFELEKGPIFQQLVMFDEINRAPPKTQSATLQAMAEKEVTIGNHTYKLQKCWQAVATRNPLEQEGTYPLPEAQMDRFLFELSIKDASVEDRIKINRMLADGKNRHGYEGQPVLERGELELYQNLAAALPVGDDFVASAVKLVAAFQPSSDNCHKLAKEYVEWDPGPRAEMAFWQAARGYALLEGTYAPNISHIKKLAKPILGHRMSLNYSAKSQGYDVDALIAEVVNDVL